jgi:RimJ/RimL family protein N-acetyltransferase
VQRYAGCADNLVYMPWGPNDEAATRQFIAACAAAWEATPCPDHNFAVVWQDELIGGCNIAVHADVGEIGWVLHRDHWKQGYGPEAGAALLRFGFEQLGLRRIVATCDAENYGSYRVMEKIGMRREGLFRQARPAHKGATGYGDTLSYAILCGEWRAVHPGEHTSIPRSGPHRECCPSRES